MDEGNWQPIIEDVEEVTNSSGVLISKARQLFFEKFEEKPINVCRDKYGTIAYEYSKIILCAKDYIYGYIVSCHKELVIFAKEKNKKLIMYINKTSSKFYEFDVDDILKSGTENKRGGNIMINFDIKIGVHFLGGKNG